MRPWRRQEAAAISAEEASAECCEKFELLLVKEIDAGVLAVGGKSAELLAPGYRYVTAISTFRPPILKHSWRDMIGLETLFEEIGGPGVGRFLARKVCHELAKKSPIFVGDLHAVGLLPTMVLFPIGAGSIRNPSRFVISEPLRQYPHRGASTRVRAISDVCQDLKFHLKHPPVRRLSMIEHRDEIPNFNSRRGSRYWIAPVQTDAGLHVVTTGPDRPSASEWRIGCLAAVELLFLMEAMDWEGYLGGNDHKVEARNNERQIRPT
ncbi:hypothetical protein [Ensifer adhaerens]